jgi:hypothetical protein
MQESGLVLPAPKTESALGVVTMELVQVRLGRAPGQG